MTYPFLRPRFTIKGCGERTRHLGLFIKQPRMMIRGSRSRLLRRGGSVLLRIRLVFLDSCVQARVETGPSGPNTGAEPLEAALTHSATGVEQDQTWPQIPRRVVKALALGKTSVSLTPMLGKNQSSMVSGPTMLFPDRQ